MRMPCLAFAALLLIFSTDSRAEVRTVQAGDVEGLIQAVLDANANPTEWMVVVVKGSGTFLFDKAYGDTDFALPALEGARLAVIIERKGVVFELDPPVAKSSHEDREPLGWFWGKGGDIGDAAIALFMAAEGGDRLDRFAELVGSGNSGVPDIKLENAGLATYGLTIRGSVGRAVNGNDSSLILAETDIDTGRVCSGGCINITQSSEPITNWGFNALQFAIEDTEIVAAKQLVLATIAHFITLAASGDIVLWKAFMSNRSTSLLLSGPSSVLIGLSFLEYTAGSGETVRVANLDGTAGKRGRLGAGAKVVPRGTIRVENSVIGHASPGQAIYLARAKLELRGVTIAAEDALDVRLGGSVEVYRSILGIPAGDGFGSDRDPACEIDVFSDGLMSLGYNLSADDSCGLTRSTDRQNVDPHLTNIGEARMLPGLAGNSPAIDGGPFRLVNGELPCGTTDVAGTARPQDGDGNGRSECDIGAIEVASRAGGIDGRQSGAYYDLSRNGEGVFLEMLSPTTALVYLFSYRPNGDPFWALGIGEVVGNGIVIRKQDFLTTRGATFGPSFDPADVEFIPFADVSLSFPDCRNTAKTGSLTIAANDELGFGPLLSKTQRLTFILDCASRAALGPGYSGSFFDPSHDGEGIILQVIDGTTVVVQWFTYDDQGNQYWIQGVGTLSGGKITVDEALAFRGPRYGPNYDAGDLEPTTWGSIMVEFDGCNAAKLTYESVIAGFGQGMQNLQRLTSLRGVDCP